MERRRMKNFAITVAAMTLVAVCFLLALQRVDPQDEVRYLILTRWGAETPLIQCDREPRPALRETGAVLCTATVGGRPRRFACRSYPFKPLACVEIPVTETAGGSP